MDIISDNKPKIYIVLLCLLGFFLNQSSIIFGVNFSFADIFLVFILFYLLFTNKLRIAIAPLLFFLFLTISVVTVSVYYVPYKFGIYVGIKDVFTAYTKLVISFSYFIIGNTLAKRKELMFLVKAFAFTAVFISIISFITFILNIGPLNDLLYYSTVRLRGLMNDPNYFSVLQLSALAYFVGVDKEKSPKKYLVIIILLISILLSGSKTAFITLTLFTIHKLFFKLLKRKTKLLQVIKVLFYLIIITFLIIFGVNILNDIIKVLSQLFPIFERVSVLFVDFNSAINSSGSGRNSAWIGAISLFKLSPLYGIGIGTYTVLSTELYGIKEIAHNTYLQLYVEWGAILATIFFGYVVYVYFKSLTFYNKLNDKDIVCLSGILLIFLISSIAISLNNARLFWIVIGGLAYLTKNRQLDYSS